MQSTQSTPPLLDSINFGFIVSYDGMKVISSHSYFIVQESMVNGKTRLYTYLERKNKQWMTLKFNSSVLVILNAGRRNESSFYSVQAYGRVELITDEDLFDVICTQKSSPWEEVEKMEFKNKYVGFALTVDNVIGIESLALKPSS